MANSYEVAQLYASMSLKGMNTVGAELTALQKSLFNLRTAFSLIGRGVASLAKTGATFESYRKRLEAVTDSADEASKVFKEMSEWAAINPVNTDDAIAAFVRLKTAAVANAEEATKQLGNLSAVMGVTMEEASMALVSLNSRYLRRMGVILDQTGSKAKIQIGNVVTYAEKSGSAMQAAIVSAIEKAYKGQMEAMKNTWQGTINTMGGMWVEFKRQVAGDSGSGGPFDMLRLTLVRVRKELEKFASSDRFKAFISRLQTSINNLFISTLKAVATISDKLGDLIGYVERYTSTFEYGLLGKLVFGTKGLAIGTAIGWIKDEVFDSIESQLTAKQRETYRKLKSAVTEKKAAMDPTGWFSGELTETQKKDIDKAEKDLSDFIASATTKTFSNSLKTFSKGLSDHVTYLSAVNDDRGRMVDGEHSDAVVKSIKKASKEAKDLEALLKADKSVIEQMQREMTYGTKTIDDFYDRIVKSLGQYSKYSENWAQWADVLQTKYTEAASKIKQKFDEGQISQKQYAEGITDIVRRFEQAGLKVPEDLQKMVDSLDNNKQFLTDLKKASKDWCSMLQEGITDAIVECESLSDVLASVGKQMEKFALQWALWGQNGSGGLLGSWLTGLFGSISGTPTTAGVHHSGGIVGSESGITRYLPRFHTGGVVGSDEELAVLRKGEGVFTEAQMKALGGVGGGVSVNVTVNNSGTGSMTDEQALSWGNTLKSAVSLQVQKELYRYRRQGYAF